MSPEEKKLEKLYALYEELSKQKRYDEANCLKWAIYTVEQTYNIRLF